MPCYHKLLRSTQSLIYILAHPTCLIQWESACSSQYHQDDINFSISGLFDLIEHHDRNNLYNNTTLTSGSMVHQGSVKSCLPYLTTSSEACGCNKDDPNTTQLKSICMKVLQCCPAADHSQGRSLANWRLTISALHAAVLVHCGAGVSR